MKRLLLLPLLLAAACQSQPPAGDSSPDGDAVQQDPAAPAQTRLEPVDVEARLAAARAALEADDPYEALTVLDEVHAAEPERVEAWYLRGTAALAAAELGQAAGDFYLDAQTAFERAAELGAGPDALVGASRAARMNLEPERALELARAAQAAWEALDPRPELEQPLERTLIEALFGAYVEQRQAGEAATELFGETEERLTALTAREPDDAWAWTQLSNLHQWEQQLDLAAQACERALLLSPDDEAMHARFVQLMRSLEDQAALRAAYERFQAAHPSSALGLWFPAVESFQAALVELHADRESVPGFEAAAALFVRCRELEPSYEDSCRGYEVICRAGVGWARYGQGDLEGATQAFLSMEEVVPNGMDWQIEGSLLSGVMGLQFVADKYAQRGSGEFDLEGKPEAAATFDLLREHRPENGDFANNAGFFHRDTCVILELQAQARLRHAQGRRMVRRSSEDVPIEAARFEEVSVEVAPEEAAALREEAAELRALAVEHAHKSYRAYQAAARLSADDVRVVNDAALVMVYHIRADVDEMEGLLLRAIEMGSEQIADPQLSPEELDLLLEAWGDAHQNMGLVYLTLKDDPATARTWFEKSFEIGPRPRIGREWIEQAALPACDKALAGDPDALEGLDPRLWLHVRP